MFLFFFLIHLFFPPSLFFLFITFGKNRNVKRTHPLFDVFSLAETLVEPQFTGRGKARTRASVVATVLVFLFFPPFTASVAVTGKKKQKRSFFFLLMRQLEL